MKFYTQVFIAVSLLAVGCTDGKQQKLAEEAKKNDPKVEDALVMTADERDKAYTKDVIRYTLGTSDLGTWGYCLSLSSWAKEAGNGQYTFLCPTDESLKKMERGLVTELNLPENKKLLDRYMALHILKGQLRYENLMGMKEVETIDGQKLKVDPDAQTIDGVKFTKREVVSETMYLVVTEDLLRYPEAELKSSAGRRLPQKKAS